MDITIISKIARNELMRDFFNALGIAFEEGVQEIEGLERKTFIFDATNETLEQWENFMELEPRQDYSLRDRAERILYTLRARGSFTKDFLKEQAKIFTNGEIEITEDYAGYAFTIQFTSVVGLPPNMENFRNMIELNKPAHLNYQILFRYNVHDQVAYVKHTDLHRKRHSELYDTRLYEDSAVQGRFKSHRDNVRLKHSQMQSKSHTALYEERR